MFEIVGIWLRPRFSQESQKNLRHSLDALKFSIFLEGGRSHYNQKDGEIQKASHDPIFTIISMFKHFTYE